MGGLSPRIALLRAVNVGGAKVAMAELRKLAEDLGLGRPKTLLNSGNLVFDSSKPPDRLEALLERETETKLGVKTPYMVRTLGEWREIIAANPYPQEARDDPGHLVLMAFKDAPAGDAVEDLKAANPGREYMTLKGREIFVVYPDGQGESKLNPLWPRKLKTPGTGRNWNTVLKLEALAASAER
jgi:uncharacterized protein (DUF1697 family)